MTDLKARLEWVALVLGILGPAVALGGMGLAIAGCSGFSWRQNALSDLGHALLSPVAVTFNLSLATGGVLLIAFSVGYGWRRFPLTSLLLGISAYFLILVASAYSWERRSPIPAIAIPVSLAGWLAYSRLDVQWGIAVPELVAVAAWLAWYVDMVWRVSIRPAGVSLGARVGPGLVARLRE